MVTDFALDSILSTKWRPDLGVTGNISQSIIGEYIRAIREEFHDLWQVAKTYSKQNIWRILHLVKTAVVSRVNSSPSCHQSFLNSPLPTRLYSSTQVTICHSSRAPRTPVRALKQPKIAPLTYNSPALALYGQHCVVVAQNSFLYPPLFKSPSHPTQVTVNHRSGTPNVPMRALKQPWIPSTQWLFPWLGFE